METAARFPKVFSLTALLIAAWLMAGRSGLEGAWRVPYQSFEPAQDCRQPAPEAGYFRPEYVELAERLEPETLDWLVRRFPELGWQDMDSRLFRPKPIPGAAERKGFRYDTARRNLQLQALFHFGPVNGNGTLIQELLDLDRDRLLTVNRGSRNLSVIDIKNPDVDGVIPAPRGVTALELNLPSQELYLVEPEARGMLVYSLRNYAVSDTLFLDFHPGAVLLSPDTRFLFFTDEPNKSLVRLDLAGHKEPVKAWAGSEPPYLLAGDSASGCLLIVSRPTGQVRAFAGLNLAPVDCGGSLQGTLLAYCAAPEGDCLYLAAGDCRLSVLYRLSPEPGPRIRIEKLAELEGGVSRLSADSRNGLVFALAGRTLYRIDPAQPADLRRVSLESEMRGLLAHNGNVYLAGGLRQLLILKADFKGKPRRVSLEMGPGPLLARDNRLFAVNSLSNSITILDSGSLEEGISILVGVFLGRMVYQDNMIVVNNIFRDNVMVLNPESYIIEDIVPAGGSLVYSPEAPQFVLFDDSLVVATDGLPSRVAIRNSLDLPQGVKLFARTANPSVYWVADQDLYVSQVDLSQRFRRGMVPLPSPCRGLFILGGEVLVFAPEELYRFSVSETIGLSGSYSVRPFKFSPPFLAADDFSRARGSNIEYLSRDRLVDITSTLTPVRVMRRDPDTTYTYIGTEREVQVYGFGSSRQRSIIPVDQPVEDIYLPIGSKNGYIATAGKIKIVDRQTLYGIDEIDTGGEFVYAWGDELYLRDIPTGHRLSVADGYRGSVFQQLELPLAPTDAAADADRLFLLGGAEGALAIYVNRLEASRLPRSADRGAWDTAADRRSGTHR